MKRLVNKTNVLSIALMVFAIVFSLAVFQFPSEAKIGIESGAEDNSADSAGAAPFDDPHVKAAIGIQNRYTPDFLKIPDVVGTATGLTDDGQPAVLVFTRRMFAPGELPDHLEDTPVVAKFTGEFVAMRRSVDPAGTFVRPVPIGVSTGNEGECSAGTIGARVKNGNGVLYALSNNHVYALENRAAIESRVLQPGRYDTSCLFDADNVIGTLSSYVPINFSGGLNRVDAAIARTDAGLLGKSTPANGYGSPNSATAAATVGLSVQKYGRTTALTKGRVSGINATIIVGYGSGNATFVNQIVVYSGKPFIKAGDSGSLLVTNNANANPVGLLFAGSSSGQYAIANPIESVLSSFGVSIDGK